MEKHICNDCLPTVLPGLVEAGSITISKDPKKENWYGLGFECDICHYTKRITYKVTVEKSNAKD